MRLRLVAAVFASVLMSALAWCPAPLRADAGPMVRSAISGDGQITVGQPLSMTIDILVPTWLTGGPQFPEIEVADAVVIFMERSGSNLSERIDGETWAGLRREYLIYALRPGPFEIRGEEVVVRYAVDAKPSPPTPVPIPSVSFIASVPPEAAGLEYFVSASDLKIDASLDRSPEGLKIGQSLTRTIEIEATDSFSMMLPPVDAPPIEGVAVYPGDPRLSDSSGERGAMRVSRRVETVTYLFQEPGDYTLAPIEISWWEAEEGRLRSSTVPALELRVADDPEMRAEIPLAPEEMEPAASDPREDSVLSRVRSWLVPLVVALVALGFALRWWKVRGPELRDELAERRRARGASEPACFRRFRAACRGNDPAAAYRALVAWCDRVNRPAATTVASLVRRSGDDALRAEVSRLEAEIFGVRSIGGGVRGETWNGAELCRRVIRLRRTLVRTGSAGPVSPEALPPLNP